MLESIRRLVPLAVLALAGCSNAPLAGTLDLIRPSRPERLGLDRGLLGPAEAPPPSGGGRLPVPPVPPAEVLTPQNSGSEFVPPAPPPGNSLPLPPPEPSPLTPRRPPLPPNT